MTPTRSEAPPSGLRGTTRPNALPGRSVVRDGDLTYPAGPEPVRDGIVPYLDETAPVEATPLEDRDLRSASDIDAFENPPAGYDPLLFQIEDVSTDLDRRPRRLFTRDEAPYDPVGVRIGTFVLFPELEVGLTGYSNVLSAPDASSDRAIDIRPSARLVSNWANHALELRGSVDASSYDTFKTEDERGYLIEGRGRLDITRRTNLQAVLSREKSQESRSAVDAATVGPRTDVVANRAVATLNHRFNRLRLRLRGGAFTNEYGSDALAGPSGSDRDYDEREFAVRATWEFKPTLLAFAEFEANTRGSDRPAASDGRSRDSNGTRYRLGVSFGETGERLRGEIALGYGRQDLDDPALADVDGFLIDANLAYRYSGLTSFLLTARTGFIETTTAGSGGVIEHALRFETRHAFRPHIIATSGIGYASRHYAGIDVGESELVSDLSLEYLFSREVALLARYERTVFRSDFANSDFEANEIRVGVRFRR